MQARYEGHLIQVSAVQVPHSGLWRCVAVIHWSERNEGHLKTLSCEHREFANEDDALRIALEVAQKWIRDGKPGTVYVDDGFALAPDCAHCKT